MGRVRSMVLACMGAVCLTACEPNVEPLELLGATTWRTQSIVGLSGLHMEDGGMTFRAIGDEGWYLEGRLERQDGRISGVEIDRLLPLLGSDGLPVSARRVRDWADSEGIAVAPDGGFWVSFERWARVAYYPDATAPAQWIKDHASFRELADNRQLEAAALHPDGRLFTFSERPSREGFPIYRLDGATWVIDGHIAPKNRFAIVGADFAPDGQLYLLERRLVLGRWWRSRIRRLDIDAPDATQVLWTSGWGEYDNLEGLSIWEDDTGLRLTLVSDDNGNVSEPTQFVEFRVRTDP